MCPGSEQWNPCANAGAGGFKGTLWDDGDCLTPDPPPEVVKPLIAEVTIAWAGSVDVSFYFAARCGTSRTQDWRLYTTEPAQAEVLQKSGQIIVTGNGQYLNFGLGNVVPGTVVRFETENLAPTNCPTSNGNSVLSGVFLSNCETCIDLIKEVSVDGGNNWFDANDCATAPNANAGAEYRLTIENCGQEDLTNIVITDPTLLINYSPAGTLIPGQIVTITSGLIPELDQPDRCLPGPGDYENTATVDALGVTSGDPVSDDDPACVVCTEQCGDLIV
jgi:hypothetical protein